MKSVGVLILAIALSACASPKQPEDKSGAVAGKEKTDSVSASTAGTYSNFNGQTLVITSDAQVTIKQTVALQSGTSSVKCTLVKNGTLTAIQQDSGQQGGKKKGGRKNGGAQPQQPQAVRPTTFPVKIQFKTSGPSDSFDSENSALSDQDKKLCSDHQVDLSIKNFNLVFKSNYFQDNGVKGTGPNAGPDTWIAQYTQAYFVDVNSDGADITDDFVKQYLSSARSMKAASGNVSLSMDPTDKTFSFTDENGKTIKGQIAQAMLNSSGAMAEDNLRGKLTLALKTSDPIPGSHFLTAAETDGYVYLNVDLVDASSIKIMSNVDTNDVVLGNQ